MTSPNKFKKLPRLYFSSQDVASTKNQAAKGEAEATLKGQLEEERVKQQAIEEIANLGTETKEQAQQLELDLFGTEDIVTADPELTAFLTAGMEASTYTSNEQRAQDSADSTDKDRIKTQEDKNNTKAEANEVAKRSWFKDITKKAWAGLSNLGKNANGENKTLRQIALEVLKIAAIISAGGFVVTGLAVAAPGIISLAGAITGGTATTAAFGVSFANIGLATAATTTAQVMSLAAGGGLASLGMSAAALADKLDRKSKETASPTPQTEPGAGTSEENQNNQENREQLNKSIDLKNYPAGTTINIEVVTYAGDGLEGKELKILTIKELTDSRKYLEVYDPKTNQVESIGHLYCKTGEGNTLEDSTLDKLEENKSHIIFNPNPSPQGTSTQINIGKFGEPQPPKSESTTEPVATASPEAAVIPEVIENSNTGEISEEATAVEIDPAEDGKTSESESASEKPDIIQIEGGAEGANMIKIKLKDGGSMRVPDSFIDYKSKQAAIIEIEKFTGTSLNRFKQFLTPGVFDIPSYVSKKIVGFDGIDQNQNVPNQVGQTEASAQTEKPTQSTNIFEKGGYTSIFQVKNEIEDKTKQYTEDLESDSNLKANVLGNVAKINDKLPESDQITLADYQANQAACDTFDSLPESLKTLASSMPLDKQNLAIPDGTGIDELTRNKYNRGASLNLALEVLDGVAKQALDKSKVEIGRVKAVEGRTNQQIIAQNYAQAVTDLPQGPVLDYLIDQMSLVSTTWGNGFDFESIKTMDTAALKLLDPMIQEQFGKMAEQILTGGTIDTIDPDTGEISYFANKVEFPQSF